MKREPTKDELEKAFGKKVIKGDNPGDCRCRFCHYWNGKHHKSCPVDDPEGIELWYAGKEAAEDGDTCFAEMNTPFWLGWTVVAARSINVT